MSSALHAGDLLVATPRPHWNRTYIAARHPDSVGWTTRIPQNSLLLVVAPAAAIDVKVRVLHNNQLLDVLHADVKLAQVAR